MKAFPSDMLDLRLAILGRAGSGKTNAAKVGVEALLKDRSRVCILDPTDAWYGLRLTRDRSPSGNDVVIFGGDHADLPLNEHAGATIGEAIAKASQSSIVSFANFDTEASRKRFTVDFFEALYRHNKAHIHLVVDEADTFAPQKPIGPLEATLVARFASIAKRGRIKGIRPWLITQRPASLSKEVLSQVDALISFNLIAPQDRAAVLGWLGTDKRSADLVDALPKLQRGEAAIYWPNGDRMSRHHFPLAKTFDSGRTPERGETIAAVRLKPIDVGELAKSVEALVREREENDPDRLRARIAELERHNVDLARRDIGDAEAEIEAGKRAGYEEGFNAGAAAMKAKIIEDTRPALTGFEEHANQAAQWSSKICNSIDVALVPVEVGGFASQVYSTPNTPPDRPLMVFSRSSPKWSKAVPAKNGDASLEKGPRALLQALAQLSRRYGAHVFEPARFALLAGYSPGSGTFAVYMRKLVSLGYVARSSGGFQLLPDGDKAAGPLDPLPHGSRLVEFWKGQLDKGPAALLDAIANKPSLNGLMDVKMIGERSGYSHTSGTFAVYMRKLRKLKLIERDGDLYRLGAALR